jgi:hypothetical protein
MEQSHWARQTDEGEALGVDIARLIGVPLHGAASKDNQ